MLLPLPMHTFLIHSHCIHRVRPVTPFHHAGSPSMSSDLAPPLTKTYSASLKKLRRILKKLEKGWLKADGHQMSSLSFFIVSRQREKRSGTTVFLTHASSTVLQGGCGNRPIMLKVRRNLQVKGEFIKITGMLSVFQSNIPLEINAAEKNIHLPCMSWTF